MMRARYLIGVDDTDYGDSIGTGAFARELMCHLTRDLDVRPSGITRHQFLVHPDIPYTTHNSSACLAVDFSGDPEELAAACRAFVLFLFHPGADPGLCVVTPESITAACVAFGRRAQREVVTKREAIALAGDAGILLEEHGGEGIGVIGALGGCSLRADGNDGRFIGHRGLREGVRDEMTVTEIVERTAVDRVVGQDGEPLPPETVIETRNWIHPDLRGGLVQLEVTEIDGGRCRTAKKKPGADNI
jgi:tRNA(Ile2) C34 agmatinyltransferase TiaS